MSKKILSFVFLSFLFLLSLWSKSVVATDDWVKYASPEYGFTMLVPSGTVFEEIEYGYGWGSLLADYDGIKLYAIGKLGEQASAAEIEKYGVKVTGVPYNYWRKIDEGTKSNGWVWYRTVEAHYNDKLLFGGYGVGDRGSYMLVLVTTSNDFENNKADYMKWYNSVQLLK